jgi:hypothetical protein
MLLTNVYLKRRIYYQWVKERLTLYEALALIGVILSEDVQKDGLLMFQYCDIDLEK